MNNRLSGTYHTLRLILGDQLNGKHSWYAKTDGRVLYVLMEVKQESLYVRHHIQKITGFFAAMRNFARELEQNGHHVYYLKITEKNNRQNFTDNLDILIRKYRIKTFEYQLPDEYRLDERLKEYCRGLKIDHPAVDTEHFFTKRYELQELAANKKQYRMETFYRYMRKKHNILMKNGKPACGEWNYDRLNRSKYDEKVELPPRPNVQNDVTQVLKDIRDANLPHIGSIDEKAFPWPVNREQSFVILDSFLQYGLPQFGTYQDAMSAKNETLFHSRLSFAMNTKMISPREVIDSVIKEWEKNKRKVQIQQVEGFIRQILGWREYMRGMYWAHMPGYEKKNYFSHKRKLPEYFWNAETKMNCMKHAINQSLDTAYAHHIQRLMVTGNFALLAGIDPDEVDLWYLGIYIDAIQWVEITNTRGMSQYADGGIIASKPYVSSANYIDKMSDKACPYNSFYWHFLDRNRKLLQNNPRMALMYKAFDRLKDKKVILRQAKFYLNKLDEL